MKKLILLLLLALFSVSTFAGEYRSETAKREFKKLHHCPANNMAIGPCTGYVIDHIIPLCAGGKDDPANMQWQDLESSKVKDKQERKFCACLRKGNLKCEM